MPATALYYALSTIAQVAATLAALIGFLGMWRLDRLRDGEREVEDEVIAEVLQLSSIGPDSIPRTSILPAESPRACRGANACRGLRLPQRGANHG